MSNGDSRVVERHTIPLESHQKGLSGLTIAHLSDLHAGPFMRQEHLQEIVAETNDLNPDIIAITGDIMNWQPWYIPEVIHAFEGLRARIGSFAILGNHDYYAGPKRLVRAFHDETPVRFVGKQRLTFTDAEGLTLTGVDDPMVSLTEDYHYPEIGELAQENHPDHFHLLITHRPDAFGAATRAGYDLVLAGHTHGGQVRLKMPWGKIWNIAQYATDYDQGLFTKGRTRLYVSRGLGYTGIKLRVDCPPEIALFTLRAD